MDEVAPAAGAAAEKKPRLLRRVPTSLIVTLLGIALTAWLLPAFTRQWDDRQKAHELKTTLVTEMASATAHAVIGGDAYWSGRPVDMASVLSAWSVASVEMEARLSVYFDANVLTSWQLFSWFVARWDLPPPDRSHQVLAEVDLVSAGKANFGNLDPQVRTAIKNLLLIGDNLGNQSLGDRVP